MIDNLVFLLLYLSVSVVYLIRGVGQTNKNLRATLKCIPLVSLIAWYLYRWNLHTSANVITSNHETTLALTLAALVCSVAGDGFLVGHFKFGFLLGIVSFSMAQILYTVVLARFALRSGAPVTVIAQSALIVLCTGFAVVVLVYKRLKVVLSKIDQYRRIVTMVVIVYFVLISVMLWSSISMFLWIASGPALFGLLGGVLFYVSDLSIALSAIYDNVIFKRRVLVMVTYYTSQLCMAHGVLSLCRNDLEM